MNPFIKDLALVAVAFATACKSPPNPAEVAAREAVTDALITQSAEQCQTKPPSDTSSYQGKLAAALEDVGTQDLRTLRDHHVVVCLDRRLSEQHNGMSRDIMSVYYNNKNQNGVLSLNPDNTDNAWNTRLVTSFAKELRDGGISKWDSRWYGALYAAGPVLANQWVRDQDFEKPTLQRNAAIASTPPAVLTQ